MIVSLIAAVSENNVIGKDNDLPWHLPKEFKYFKNTTKGHHILMGRKTFESFPQPLPQRTNIIITRQNNYNVQGGKVVHSLEEGLELARQNDEDEAFVIGGAQIYKLALPLADRIYLTVIHTTVNGDTYFPAFNEKQWTITHKKPVKADKNNPHDFTIYLYEKRT